MFSVLIPAYNAGQFIAHALKSVAAQNCADWELIVVEDGSHDETEALVTTFAAEQAEHRVIYQNLGQNQGVSRARNRLMDLAHGDRLAFLDADDNWKPEHLELVAVEFERGCNFVVSGIEVWDGCQDRILVEYQPSALDLTDPVRALFERSFIQSSSSVALLQSLALRTGEFDPTLQIGEDRDFWLRCFLNGGAVGTTGKMTCRYLKHPASAMARTLRVAEDAVRFYRKYQGDDRLPAKRRRSNLAGALEVLGRLKRRSEPDSSRQLFWEALRLEPTRWRSAFSWILTCLVRPPGTGRGNK